MMDIVFAVLGQTWLPLLVTMTMAYLLGSFNFAVIVSKTLIKEDIRTKGSGNAGATNMLRSHGVGPALLTTLGDLAKSVASVLLAEYVVFPAFGCEEFGRYGAYLAGLFCIFGHMYPLYFNFRGGKGVMTTLGMMLILDWQVALIGLASFIIIVLISRMVSLGSILSVALVAILTYFKLKYFQQVDGMELLFCTLMTIFIAALLIMKHSDNIKRILNGTENKFGSKKKPDPDTKA